MEDQSQSTIGKPNIQDLGRTIRPSRGRASLLRPPERRARASQMPPRLPGPTPKRKY